MSGDDVEHWRVICSEGKAKGREESLWEGAVCGGRGTQAASLEAVFSPTHPC